LKSGYQDAAKLNFLLKLLNDSGQEASPVLLNQIGLAMF
jgi:hypothetical protein